MAYFTNILQAYPCCYKWEYFSHFHDWVIPHMFTFELFPSLGYLNSATVNIGMHVYFWIFKFSFSPDIYPGMELLDYMVALFLGFLKSNVHSILCTGCTNSHSHQQWRTGPFSPHTLSTIYLSFVYFWMMVILIIVRWYFSVVLICLSLIISDVEHLFMHFLPICLSSLEKCLFRSSDHFWLGCSCFWYRAAWTVCVFWRLIPCWSFCLQIFSPIPWVLLFMVSFAVQKLLSLNRSLLKIFSITLGGGSKKILPHSCQRVFCTCFPIRVL